MRMDNDYFIIQGGKSGSILAVSYKDEEALWLLLIFGTIINILLSTYQIYCSERTSIAFHGEIS